MLTASVTLQHSPAGCLCGFSSALSTQLQISHAQCTPDCTSLLAGLFGTNSALAPNLFAPNEGIANLIADMETLGPREGVERLMSIFGRAPSRDMTYEALCQLEDVRLTTSRGTLDALPLDMVTVGSQWVDQVRCPAGCGGLSQDLQAGT